MNQDQVEPRRFAQLEALLQDVRYAIRTLARAPIFCATALATLALGIGANTAIFSVVDAVLLKPLPYPDPGRIVFFFVTTPAGISWGGSATKFEVWRRQTQIFQDVAASEYQTAGLNLTGGPYPEQVHSIRVSADYFRLLGAPIAQGRTFNADEDRVGGDRVVVLSDGLWKRRFGGDKQIVGKPILLSGVPHTVIGIVGAGFDTELNTAPDIWLPFQLSPTSSDHAHYFIVMGRLRPGVTVATANAQLQLASAEFARRFPNIMGPRDVFSVMRLLDGTVSDVRQSLVVLAGAVSFVLLIACANVANLLLVRATGRKREIAIRAVIGAGRGRIIRQLLTESMVLSIVGGALGLVLGLVGVRTLLAVNPGDIPRIGELGSAITLDWRLLAFTTSISLITGILFGLVPALNVSRADLSTALKEGGGRGGTGLHRNKTRALLVAGDMALATVLLIGAALLIRTFFAIRAVDLGFDKQNVLTMRMSLVGSRFQKTSEVNQLVREAVQRVEALPEVVRVGASYSLPPGGIFGVPFNIVGRSSMGGRYDGRGWMATSPGYFDVLKIPVLRGRAFNDRDDGGAERVAIISQAMARKFWPKSDPLDDQIILGRGYGPEFEEPARQIVGVVGDVRDFGLNGSLGPVVYVPMAQITDGVSALTSHVAPLAWLVRTRVPPHSLGSTLEREFRQVSGGLPVARIRSMAEIVDQSTAHADFNMSLLTIFGCSALLLAAIGVYGIMSYSVRQRTQELGIRMALGAGAADVRNMIVIQGLRLALAGIAIGVVAALGLSRLIASFLFGVKAYDPLVFTTVPVLLGAVALLAVGIPAYRATRINPINALRCE